MALFNKRKVGSRYEEMAARYLQLNGYAVLEKNFRCPFGEIDIIAAVDRCIVFAEVKYRADSGSGAPEEAVSKWKMKKISRVADYYRMQKQLLDGYSCRFDVIAVEGDEFRHHVNAFDYQV